MYSHDYKKKNISESYVSIGSNIGNSKKLIKKIIQFLNRNNYIHIRSYSNLYITKAVHYREQPSFYNIIIKIFTILSPYQLINIFQYLEKKYYKKKYFCSYMPRKLDIDILLYSNCYIKKKKIFLPHQNMFKRKFIKKLLYEFLNK